MWMGRNARESVSERARGVGAHLHTHVTAVHPRDVHSASGALQKHLRGDGWGREERRARVAGETLRIRENPLPSLSSLATYRVGTPALSNAAGDGGRGSEVDRYNEILERWANRCVSNHAWLRGADEPAAWMERFWGGGCLECKMESRGVGYCGSSSIKTDRRRRWGRACRVQI